MTLNTNPNVVDQSYNIKTYKRFVLEKHKNAKKLPLCMNQRNPQMMNK